VDLSIPGEFMNAITSAAPVVGEAAVARFSKGDNKDEDFKAQLKSCTNRTVFAGNVTYKAEWLGTSAKMPPKTLEYNEAVNDLKQQVSAEQIYNLNDPRVVVPRGSHKEDKKKRGKTPDFQIPYLNIISLKQLLLQQRLEREEVFRGIIPISKEALRSR